MSTAVDRKRLLQFLDAIDATPGGSNALGVTDVNGKAIVRGGRPHTRSIQWSPSKATSLQRYDLSTDQLRQIYKESLKRARGKLVHRFERQIGDLTCLCYQNSHAPRIAIIFFHGFDGSPYDFLFPIHRYFDQLGDRLPTLWVLPAGPERSRTVADLSVEQETPSILNGRSPIPTAEVSEIKTPDNQVIVQSPFGANPSVKKFTSDDVLKRKIEGYMTTAGEKEQAIDPSGGYMWWDIPAMNLLNGGKKSLKSFVQAFKQNLRTPQTFFSVRARVIDTIQSVGHAWAIPLSQIYIGGFSQGAMLASDLLVSVPSNLAGVILLSGAVIGRSDHKQAQREAQILNAQDRNTVIAAALETHKVSQTSHLCPANLNESRFQVPIFQAHGIKDPIIPFPVGKFLRKHLINLGFQHIQFESFPGGHDFPLEIGTKVFQWMLTTPPVRALANRQRGFDQCDASVLPLLHEPTGKQRRHSHGLLSATEGGKRRFGKLLDKLRGRRRSSVKAATSVGSAVGSVLDCSAGGNESDFVLGPDSDAELSLGNTRAGSISPPSSNRLAHASISFTSAHEASEEDVDFDWNHLSARASRAVAEKFLTVNSYVDTLILPPLENVQPGIYSAAAVDLMDDSYSMIPPLKHKNRQLSLFDALDHPVYSVKDWNDLHQQFMTEFNSNGDVDDSASAGSIPENSPTALRSRNARPPTSLVASILSDVNTPSTICSSPGPSPQPSRALGSGTRQHKKAAQQPKAAPGSRFADWELTSSPPSHPLRRSPPYMLGKSEYVESSPLRTSYDTLSSWCDASPTEAFEGDDVFGPNRSRADESSVVVPKNAFPRHQKMGRLKVWRSDEKSNHRRKSNRSDSCGSRNSSYQ